jgi:Tfp pilus assembly major pilin PilA
MAQVAAQHIDELTQQLEQAKQGTEAEMMKEQAKNQREMAALQSKSELQMQQAEIDAQIAIRKAAIEAETKKTIAQMEIESQEELEEMRGYFQLLAARKEPATDGLRSDVEGEFQPEGVELPRIIKRKLIKMQAPSGAVYTGSIEDDESPEMAAT